MPHFWCNYKIKSHIQVEFYVNNIKHYVVFCHSLFLFIFRFWPRNNSQILVQPINLQRSLFCKCMRCTNLNFRKYSLFCCCFPILNGGLRKTIFYWLKLLMDKEITIKINFINEISKSIWQTFRKGKENGMYVG